MFTSARATSRLCQVLRHQRPYRLFSTETSFAGDHVRIVEVGPRDGLQNEKKSIPLSTKLDLIERLAKTGLTTIEAGSFVSEKWVPQVRSLSDVYRLIARFPPSILFPLIFTIRIIY